MSIVINKILEVSSGTAPYSYTWTSDNSCVTFSQATGTTDGVIETDVLFEDESCFTALPTVTVEITDANGCTSSFTPTFNNPCSSFTNTGIQSTSGNIFSISTGSPGCSSTNIEWIYDSSIFNQESIQNTPFTSTLDLTFKPNTILPSTTTIQAKVTDCNNCQSTVTKQHTICVPSAPKVFIDLAYNVANERFESGEVTLPKPANCPTYTYDHTKNSITLPSGMTLTKVDDFKYKFRAPKTLADQTLVGQYQYTTEENIKSTIGAIEFSIGSIGVEEYISGKTSTFNLSCDDSAGDVVSLNIENLVVTSENATIDWSSWELVTPPTPESSSITLSTDINGDHIIQYTVPNPIPTTDQFAWIICTANGTCSDTVYTSVTECIQAPTAVDDTASVTCGESVTINVLDNDSGNGSPLNPATLTIESAPLLGAILKSNPDGSFTYTSLEGQSGTDVFQYSIKNQSGETSNVASVTVTVNCAGQDSKITLCN